MAKAVKLTDSTKIRVDSFRRGEDGDLYLNIRKFYKTKNSDEWKPAAQGISIPQEHAKKIISFLKDELENIEENAKVIEDTSKAQSKTKKGKK